ncbi:RING finger and transmembrane domain-containing protein 2 isoform X3 [Abrus precatorius]|uniref:RING finger and transmembrane domain-containing protein 2 isoform X3 n=1 Tax=Abrus precatorius TaxID=3816 RepID=A0A8B8L220_ABRPR|nr:RING finger and transmembrane domain-containing protein 2 isoform X3 [Abrus precatorius]
MEGNGDMFRASSPGVGPSTSSSSLSSASRRYGILSASNIIQAPLSVLLEYSGILPSRSNHHSQANPDAVDNDGEVSIRIIGPTEHEHQREEQSPPGGGLVVGLSHSQNEAGLPSSPPRGDVEGVSQAVNGGGNGAADAEAAAGGGDGVGPNGRDSSYQRYDIQHAARWIEQVLPFSLLLLVVFIRQHLQGFFVTIWIAAVLFKSNDILRKQTALKGERKIPVLIGISVMFALHVVGVYWWYQNDDIMYPLIMLPPKDIPPFWHAIFIIMVNDTLVRQAAMVFKCMLLMYYKNSRGRNYRKQVQSFFAAVKALSRKEVHYGAYATSEQVNAAGDLCAICQEKMHAPILLRCKHIFCEDCVSEWFERERTCPLCRALVKPADLRSFGDGSTSLFFQLF